MTEVLTPDVPYAMAERVAKAAHSRSCASFNGKGTTPAPKFAGSHRDRDVLWARIHIADVCTGLGITPDQLGGVAAEPKEHGNG